jgi:hypothetical protein
MAMIGMSVTKTVGLYWAGIYYRSASDKIILLVNGKADFQMSYLTLCPDDYFIFENPNLKLLALLEVLIRRTVVLRRALKTSLLSKLLVSFFE